MKSKSEVIDLQDGLNGDWLANARKMRNMTKAQKRRFIKKMERMEMVEVSQSDLDKAFGNKP